MLRSRNFARFLTIAVLLMALTAVSMVHAQDKKILTTGINMTNGDPESLDPGLAQDTKQIQILDELYVGLTRLDEVSLEVKPGLAESWTISEDGKVFTFKLRKDIPWVRYNADTDAVEELKDDAGNVRYVTANDLVYAWKRNFDPATASPYIYVLAPYVTGGADFKGPDSELGVKATDDYTVEITSPVVAGFALNIYGMWFSRPLPQFAIDDAGTSWTEPENIATYGPFAFKEWKHEESATLIKNPFWPGTDAVPQPKLDEVVIKFLDDSTQLPEYEAGTMDAVEVPADQLDRVKADPTLSKEYSNGVQNCTYYYGFNSTKAPFTSAHMRLAFSYAIDRAAITDNILKAGQIPARWYTRPGNVGAPTVESAPADFGVSYNVDKAKEELAAGLKELGVASVADLPSITLAFGNTPTHTAIAQAIQQMWKDTLGVSVELAALDTTTYFSVQREDSNQIFRAGWCADYPDANNWLNETMHSGVPQNYGKFSNPEFDKLVEQAAELTDNAERGKLYAQAEEILVAKDGGIAPIYWYVTKQLRKPNVEGTYSVIGAEYYEKWDIKQ
ncbi:MAG: hypothetical protein GC179_20135 [Anaerolineaceae bacterium]|nr:hypothetical protein [Anaerolineaceae bacterium]